MEEDLSSVPAQDAKNLALLGWAGSLFFGIFPGLILYLLKQDDDYVLDQAKEMINWSITAMAGYLLAYALTLVAVGVLLFPLIGLCHFVFCLMGAVGCYQGKPFRVPLAIRLIK